MNKSIFSLLAMVLVTLALTGLDPVRTKTIAGVKDREGSAAVQNSESSMTLQATIDYIRDKVEGYAVFKHGGLTGSYKVGGVSNCILTMSAHSKDSSDDGTLVRIEDEVATIPLWAIKEPHLYEHGDIVEVILDTQDFAKLIKKKRTTQHIPPKYFESEDNKEEQWVSDDFRIAFGRSDADNRDIAERVHAAFAHAINLCCAAQPRDNDPFAPAKRTPCGKKP
jgi:hypothetical protein